MTLNAIPQVDQYVSFVLDGLEQMDREDGMGHGGGQKLHVYPKSTPPKVMT